MFFSAGNLHTDLQPQLLGDSETFSTCNPMLHFLHMTIEPSSACMLRADCPIPPSP